MTSFNERLRAAMLSDAEAAENKRLRAAPATAPEFPADWAQMIHYPECWDTAAYPELRDAIHEALAWSGCSVCKPSTAPAWHDAQQAEIESLRWTVKDALESLDNGMTADCRATLSSATKETP